MLFFKKHERKKNKQTDSNPTSHLSEERKERSKLLQEERDAFAKGFPLYERGEAYRKAKEFGKALEQYDLAAETGYYTPALCRGYVRIYKQQKEYDKAIAKIDLLIEQDKIRPFNSVAYAELVSERDKLIEKLQYKSEV